MENQKKSYVSMIFLGSFLIVSLILGLILNIGVNQKYSTSKESLIKYEYLEDLIDKDQDFDLVLATGDDLQGMFYTDYYFISYRDGAGFIIDYLSNDTSEVALSKKELKNFIKNELNWQERVQIDKRWIWETINSDYGIYSNMEASYIKEINQDPRYLFAGGADLGQYLVGKGIYSSAIKGETSFYYKKDNIGEFVYVLGER